MILRSSLTGIGFQQPEALSEFFPGWHSESSPMVEESMVIGMWDYVHKSCVLKIYSFPLEME